MIPRARLLSDAFWWGRDLERFYMSYRMLLANETLDMQCMPEQSSASMYGWSLLATGQWKAFHERFSVLDRLHQWQWWTAFDAPSGMPSLYGRLRQGLRAMRGELRSEWFEQWNAYQGSFEKQSNTEYSLEHPVLIAVSQLYPLMLGRLEMDYGRTSLTHWIRMGIEWERIDITVRLLILYARDMASQEQLMLGQWINVVQDLPHVKSFNVHEWFSGKGHLRTLPAIYARLGQCMRDDVVLSRLALPVMPVKLEATLLLDYQSRLTAACSELEALIGSCIEGL